MLLLVVWVASARAGGLDLKDIPDAVLMSPPPGATPLLAAAIRQDVDAVRQLLEDGANPNIVTGGLYLALCTAIAGLRGEGGDLPAERMEIFTLLIRHGARADINCYQHQTPLSLAFELEARNAIRHMLDAGMRKSDGDESDVYRHSLWKSVGQDDFELLSMLLEAGVHPDTVGRHGGTPVLLDAVRALRVKMVRALLDAGADIRAALYLHAAMQQRTANTEIVQLLLDAGADPNQHDADVLPPLVWAAYYDLAPLVKMLLDAGAKPNVHTRNGNVLLEQLGNRQHKESVVSMVNALIDAGADPHYLPRSPVSGQKSPFVAAIESGNIDLLNRYLALGVDVDRLYFSHDYRRCMDARAGVQPQGQLVVVPWFKQSIFNGCEAEKVTPLVRAIRGDNVEVFAWLLEHGANPHLLIGEKATLLEYAARRYSGGPFVDLLIAAGVAVDVVAYSAWPIGVDLLLQPAVWHPPEGVEHEMPILTAAALGGHVVLVDKLIAAGADPNKRAAGGSTPMHCLTAAQPGGLVKYHKAARSILAAGADLTRLDDEGYTPVTRALSGRDTRMIELIFEQDFDVNARDGRGRTPLAVAIEFNGLKHIVRALLRKGALVGERELELVRKTNFPSLIELVESKAQS